MITFWEGNFYDEAVLYQYCNFTRSYSIDVDHVDLTSLSEFLIKHPNMGTKHPVGDMLIQAIERHKQEEQGTRLKPTADTGMLLYRGRNRKEESKDKYPFAKMWAPPKGHANYGRYNAIGVPVSYLLPMT
ncbi:hypothetical protein [Paenibacillus sp. GCM10012306]|uniref:hypothetical protein n=1 Tax=Paenibacillus sp. GCM10012306 TaxID=3317342 RepID=UPI00360AC972